MAACQKCFTILPEGATVCPACGTPVPRMAPTPAAAPAPRTFQGPSYAAPTPPAAFGGYGDPSRLLLFPGETVLARYQTTSAQSARVARLNMLLVFAILVPVMLLPLLAIALTGPLRASELIIFLPILLIAVVFIAASRANRSPSQHIVLLTDRRVITQKTRPQATSAAMSLENLGDVQVSQSNWAARRAGVAWVYLLPMGTSTAIVGGGRVRYAAPGVIWVPAMPVAEANDLRNRVLTQARAVQSRMVAAMAPPPPPPSGPA